MQHDAVTHDLIAIGYELHARGTDDARGLVHGDRSGHALKDGESQAGLVRAVDDAC
ncbi:hypothetical protein D3C80_2166990 [compost metagenome]